MVGRYRRAVGEDGEVVERSAVAAEKMEVSDLDVLCRDGGEAGEDCEGGGSCELHLGCLWIFWEGLISTQKLNDDETDAFFYR